MPHSLRAKIKGLRYKGIITDKDCDRLCIALDNENVLDKIRTEIEQSSHGKWYVGRLDGKTEEVLLLDEVLDIIDKYKGDKE